MTDDMDRRQNGDLPRLAEDLDALMSRVPRAAGSPALYTADQAAEEITAYGVPVTGAYLSQLRSGARDDPSAELLEAIGHVFGVSAAYFSDPELAARVVNELDLLLTIRDAIHPGRGEAST